MPTNKNAQLRYQVLDRCFSDFNHRYSIDDLVDKVNEVLNDLYGTSVELLEIIDVYGVSLSIGYPSVTYRLSYGYGMGVLFISYLIDISRPDKLKAEPFVWSEGH